MSWQNLNWKQQIARFPCGSTAFLSIIATTDNVQNVQKSLMYCMINMCTSYDNNTDYLSLFVQNKQFVGQAGQWDTDRIPDWGDVIPCLVLLTAVSAPATVRITNAINTLCVERTEFSVYLNYSDICRQVQPPRLSTHQPPNELYIKSSPVKGRPLRR